MLAEAIYEMNFWDSIQRSGYRRKGKRGRILTITRAIWLHQNEAIFKRSPVSIDNVVDEIEGLMASWAYRVS